MQIKECCVPPAGLKKTSGCLPSFIPKHFTDNPILFEKDSKALHLRAFCSLAQVEQSSVVLAPCHAASSALSLPHSFRTLIFTAVVNTAFWSF